MRYYSAYLILLLAHGCGSPSSEAPTAAAVTTIAFGSCGHQTHPLPIFDSIVKQQPDLFIFLGDNIYGDTKDMQVLADKYQALADKPSFQRLKKNVPILATWDDHDYGWNDSGRHYAFKEPSKALFLDFFDEAADSPRRQRPGIYTVETIQQAGKTLQIILLDTRSFRDDLLPYDGSLDGERRFFYPLDYIPHKSPDSTLLGKEQWAWLEKILLEPADLRLIASSTQFGITYNGYEAWVNFPHEQKRMLDLIRKTKANGVLFLSGDVHYAEISKLESPDLYPLYDITSSGLSSTWYFATPNENRIEGPVMDNHFGLLKIFWNEQPLQIEASIWDIRGKKRLSQRINLAEISF